MDIGTIVSIIGAGKSFLDGGDSGGQEREQKSLLDIYDDVKSRNYDIRLTQEEMAAPGKVQGIQQIDYASTRQFWDNLLREYTRK
jgi:hypothetical protein|tara:strand:- start:1000 stop:1254 length:255 start_codon:yes stop_codon:yes gene_type:complete